MLPTHHVKKAMPVYTQGVMDLGATVCTPKQPACDKCPLQIDCVAHAQGKPEGYPVKTKKLKRSSEQLWLLWAQTAKGDVWLTQRPAQGVWASLYCLPVFDAYASLQAAVPAKHHAKLQELGTFKHVLTHKDLHIHPVFVQLPKSVVFGAGQWVHADAWPALGLPAPVRKLLVSR